jgi:hypothetical protein
MVGRVAQEVEPVEILQQIARVERQQPHLRRVIMAEITHLMLALGLVLEVELVR